MLGTNIKQSVVNNDPLLRRRQAAAYLNIAEQTMADWECTHRIKLRSYKIGKFRMYKQSDLDAFIAAQKA